MKLWLLPCRLIDDQRLKTELQDVEKLFVQIGEKYDQGWFRDNSPLMRRFYRFQPYVFLRYHAILNELTNRQYNCRAFVYPKDIRNIPRCSSFYKPKVFLIQNDVEDLFDIWQTENSNFQLTGQLSILTINQLSSELETQFQFLRERFKIIA